MLNKPKVSVVLPVYNNEHYLERCIRSVLDQTMNSIEVILIDDGSTDSSPIICDYFAKKDNRVQVIHKKNEGSAAGRNEGMNVARGEYISFVDSDDFLASDMYEKLYVRARELDADIVKCSFSYCVENQRREDNGICMIEKEGNVFDVREHPQIIDTHPSIWAGIYRKSFLEKFELRFLVTPKASYSDYSWAIMTYAHAHRITIVPLSLYLYTYDNPASSWQREGILYQQLLYHAKESHRILREAGIWEETKFAATEKCIRSCLHAAYGVAPKYREDFFRQLRDVLIDLFQDDFIYVNSKKMINLLIQLVLENKCTEFFSSLQLRYVMENPERYAGVRIVLFGAGECGQSYASQLANCGIYPLKWIDNNPKEWQGTESPNSLFEVKFDKILLAVTRKDVAISIKEQLSSMGIKEEKIVWDEPIALF